MSGIGIEYIDTKKYYLTWQYI